MVRKGTPVIMVSSSVYEFEDTLNQIYAILTKIGYQVWMSHNNTLPINSKYSNFDNCIRAVKKCDAFLGIIRGKYGSGQISGQRSITHKELLKAINLKKRRWVFVDHDVKVAEQILKQFRYCGKKKKKIVFKPTPIIDDIRIIEMYEDAIRKKIPIQDRKGNWVQEYRSTKDLIENIEFQLKNIHGLWPRRNFK